MQPTLIPSRTDDAAAFIAERAQAARDEAQEHAETRAEHKAQLTRTRLMAKLAAMRPLDLVAGLHSATEEAHGGALLTAWSGSTEQFGALVKALIVDALEAECDLQAEEALAAIEAEARAESAPRHRTFLIAGV